MQEVSQPLRGPCWWCQWWHSRGESQRAPPSCLLSPHCYIDPRGLVPPQSPHLLNHRLYGGQAKQKGNKNTRKKVPSKLTHFQRIGYNSSFWTNKRFIRNQLPIAYGFQMLFYSLRTKIYVLEEKIRMCDSLTNNNTSLYWDLSQLMDSTETQSTLRLKEPCTHSKGSACACTGKRIQHHKRHIQGISCLPPQPLGNWMKHWKQSDNNWLY